MWQGLKPNLSFGAICGTTKVMPCYKARFNLSGSDSLPLAT
jgi:hypothetical protein